MNSNYYFLYFYRTKEDKMKKIQLSISILTMLLFVLFSCQHEGNVVEVESEEKVDVDTLSVLDHLMNRGVLVAVTNCSPFNYKMQDSRPTGFEYELLSDLCNSLNVKLELIVNDNLDTCFQMLDSCKVDLVATGLGLTKEVKKRFLATNPIILQKSVLVQRLPKGWSSMSTVNEVENQLLRSPMDLAGKTIYVPKGSHAVTTLEHLSDEIGDTIFIAESDTLSSMELINAVHDGLIDYTVVDEYIAKVATKGMNGMDIQLEVSVEQPLGWALRQEKDSSLLVAVNNWIENAEQKNLRRVLNKYVTSTNRLMLSKSSAHISEYDAAIKKTAKNIGWDWRLLASIIYQESRFQLDLESDKGAYGLMQLMPAVMEQYGIDYDSSPEEQIAAGGRMIKFLDDALSGSVADSTERAKFVLAGYNAGLGHVLDAQRLARKYGKDPAVWENNVDFFILNKSKAQYYNDTCCKCGPLRGTQTYRFVEEVTERFHHYQALIDG